MPESFCYKVAGLRPATLIKKRLWHRCFPMSFAKFLRTSFFTEHFWWLLLNNAGGLSANDMFDNNIRVLKVNSFMICKANKWTGFYMITASVMKKLNLVLTTFLLEIMIA